MKNSVNVYFDESGYTGENLLSDNQPTFSYATVKITDTEAAELVNKILSKYPKQTQSGELKATTLLKSEKGIELISEVLIQIQNNIKISVSDKKYALAAKFFEYMIEPVIASKSSIFYSLNFHKYISNVLYMGLEMDNDELSKELFTIFETLMRTKDKQYFNQLVELRNKNISSNSEEFITKILLFIEVHQEIIWDEIKDLSKWTSDLSITALNALFSELGKNGDELIAYCDNSKPLFEQQDIFTHMKGRTDIVYHPFFDNDGEKIPMTYNLKELYLADSKECKGIQLADIVAGTASSIFKMYNMNKKVFSQEIINIMSKNIVYGSVFPDFNEIDLRKKSVQLNAMLFEYMIEKSIEGTNILDDIEHYLIYIDSLLDTNPFIETI